MTVQQNKQKAIKPPHSAPEIESSLKKEKMPGFLVILKTKGILLGLFCILPHLPLKEDCLHKMLK